MAMAYGLVMDTHLTNRRTPYEPFYDNRRIKEDKVIDLLVSKGICFIDYDMFHFLKDTLPNKLRGQVLFHSDIESKKIFITYTKVAR